ncbi:NAD(P)/FAD-dependent oxidoreductase [Herbivorax sp. ANBcel31]|uniref:NAD(P)/FAD-dependent oxidoreductase n=1 Tax=Herbivorax sp. ANBcel31 TaxID=3069754 RepID=UPI0027AE11A1|nr:NAD(P)/FAD-dependent oxidoreductase [Herbivorax sp. ANBcel31]MDQ2084952.1 NAD(P)/FAD-dependent oxidoreductase [Herbivorax sp. ANBcel31]
MYDVIIIGKGPAGISASLYTVRANLKTLVIGQDDSSLWKAEKIENYYGFSEVISGKKLLDEGEKQAERLGAEILDDKVISIQQEEHFKVLTSDEQYQAKSVLIATGQPLKKVRVENLDSYEGKGVSYCTTCDGFFYNNLKVGVLGYGDYAVHEAIELEAFTKDITIFTNGKELEAKGKYEKGAERFKVVTKKVYRVDGGEVLQKIFFKDGTSEEIDGLFVAYESPSSADFAKKLGIVTEKNAIVVDDNQQTNIPGVFAAGDCTGGFKQISTAVGQGAVAGKKMIDHIRNL